jgi:peptidoglycan-associated lipoprotein
MNRSGFVSVVLLAPALTFGCAKQPATMTTAAPAPTGVAVVSPTPSSPESTQSTGRFETGRAETLPPAADQQRSGAGASGARPAPGEFVGVRDLVDVHFDFDKYAIRARDAEILDANARWLRANKDAQVLIEGHCDERGTEEYNLSLGDRRAKATVDYLVAQGIAPARLVTISYGKERPQCSEHNEACWAKNRRAHFLVKRG